MRIVLSLSYHKDKQHLGYLFMCDKNCHLKSCPFANSAESEEAQSYGCLPSSYDIVGMRIFKQKTWACHNNPKKPCKGALQFLRRNNLDARIINTTLVTETNTTPQDINFTDEQHKKLKAIMTADSINHPTIP